MFAPVMAVARFMSITAEPFATVNVRLPPRASVPVIVAEVAFALPVKVPPSVNVPVPVVMLPPVMFKVVTVRLPTPVVACTTPPFTVNAPIVSVWPFRSKPPELFTVTALALAI